MSASACCVIVSKDLKGHPEVFINGDMGQTARFPHNLNVSFSFVRRKPDHGRERKSRYRRLGLHVGVAGAQLRAACALGRSELNSRSSIRMTVGPASPPEGQTLTTRLQR